MTTTHCPICEAEQPLSPKESALYTKAADAVLADILVRQQLVNRFAQWLEDRSTLAGEPTDSDARYLQAYDAPWVHAVTQEEGKGTHQAIGPSDRLVVEMAKKVLGKCRLPGCFCDFRGLAVPQTAGERS